MTKIKPGDWIAYQTPQMSIMKHLGVTKLPTDPRTLIKVYRAAMKYRKALDQNCLDHNAVIDFMCEMDKAQKAKRAK
jgi:hypothetical protein